MALILRKKGVIHVMQSNEAEKQCHHSYPRTDVQVQALAEQIERIRQASGLQPAEEWQHALRRGDVVMVALPGDYGKARPAVVVQADVFAAHDNITVCPMTTLDVDCPLFRIAVKPDEHNGLDKLSFIMVDEVQTLRRCKVKTVMGSLTSQIMNNVSTALRLTLSI